MNSYAANEENRFLAIAVFMNFYNVSGVSPRNLIHNLLMRMIKNVLP